MIRIIALAAVLAPAAAYSQLNDTYYFSPSANCTIKEYKSGGLTQVDAKNFQGVPLKAKKLNRNPQFMAYKVAGKIYISPATCLKTTSLDSLEELETDSFDERGRRDQTDYGNRLNAADNGQRKSDAVKSFENESSRNNYFIDVSGGVTGISSKAPVFQDYGLFNGVRTIDIEGVPTAGDIIAGETLESKYKANTSISLSMGKRATESAYYLFKFRRFTGEKNEEVEATFDDGTNIYDVTGEFNFKDTFTEFMIGGKYFFLPDSKFKPYVIGLVGFSGINSKFNNVSQISFTNEYELSSSGLIASLELGTEYFFTSHISLGAGFSYNYVGTREFKLKTSDGTLTKDGFTTKMNYTNTSLSAGLKVYF